jgi:16S rRNA (guanine527-N7)-methyltransferase
MTAPHHAETIVTIDKLLDAGLDAMHIVLPAAARAQLRQFLALLEKWNQAYNLTAVRDPEEMVPRHLLDSLAVLPYLNGPEILDIGTGAGLPGIPLAIARPGLHFTLLDSNAKKLRFVRQAAHELNLRNVTVVQERIEKFHPERKFATLIARAFAAIPDILAGCGHLAAPGVRVLAMKGIFPREEIAAVAGRFRVEEVNTLHVPGLDATRHLVIITPIEEA